MYKYMFVKNACINYLLLCLRKNNFIIKMQVISIYKNNIYYAKPSTYFFSIYKPLYRSIILYIKTETEEIME